MLYDSIHTWLGWPEPEQAFEPSGAGTKAFAEFAQKKIKGALQIAYPGAEVAIGVIAADPSSDSSEAPLALVCEFSRAAGDQMLDLVHKLAWNLSRTALLVTLEPHQLIAWSCYQDPTQGIKRRLCELPQVDGFKPTGTPEQRQARDLLHWVNLVTHRAQQERPKQFPVDGRADALLLKNLRYVRGELLKLNLAQDHCHDLLARVIFTQFLFHRKDGDGNAFFSLAKMRRLHEDGTVSAIHADLASLLAHKTDTYALFSWMDERFNGDLFPGKDREDGTAQEAAWRVEKNAVTKEHLDLLANLVSGNIDAKDKQQTLWPYYSFDTIPLEFISSVYEEFLTAEERGNDKAYYTPSHLVDYVLDAVLPWGSEDWDIRILDPCCGSGIFLVKAFQRIIYRWRLAHPGKEPLVRDLRPILENNLVGVDKNPEAVRVACFSLYLAMADAIEPKHYITRDNIKVFPCLRGTRLICQDFFDEETDEIHSEANKETFDCVLGNAPWGDGSTLQDKLPDEAGAAYRKRIKTLPPTAGKKWAQANDWPIANNDVGPLFLAKAAVLVKETGFVAMVNTASLLYWRDGTGTKFRQKLFTRFSFAEVTNLSAIRRELFAEAIGAACIFVFRAVEPSPEEKFYYFTPKSARTSKRIADRPNLQGFSIEPHDINSITHKEASEQANIWPLLSLGAQRDRVLIQRLSSHPTLLKLKAESMVLTRNGVIPGDQGRILPSDFEQRRYLDDPQFPTSVFLELDASNVPKWERPCVHSRDSVNFEAFKLPQLLIKQSFSTKTGRFRAALVKSSDPEFGVICKETYLTVRDLTPQAANIRTACAVYNSRFATYFLALTSSRIGHYITETLAEELLAVPLPPRVPDISILSSFDEIDEAMRKAFGFTRADWTLIEDFLDYTLPDALQKTASKARFPTQRQSRDGTKEPELTEYAKTFVRVVKGTFGKDKALAATIFTDPDGRKLPVRMITIQFEVPEHSGISYEAIEADGLLDKLAEFHASQLKHKQRDSTGSGLGFQRVAYFFHPGRKSGKMVMNLTIVKPDECRYWMRSLAMRDADQLASAIMKAAGTSQTDK